MVRHRARSLQRLPTTTTAYRLLHPIPVPFELLAVDDRWKPPQVRAQAVEYIVVQLVYVTTGRLPEADEGGARAILVAAAALSTSLRQHPACAETPTATHTQSAAHTNRVQWHREPAATIRTVAGGAPAPCFLAAPRCSTCSTHETHQRVTPHALAPNTANQPASQSARTR